MPVCRIEPGKTVANCWHFIMDLTLCVIYSTSIKSFRMERLLAERLTLSAFGCRFYVDYIGTKPRPVCVMGMGPYNRIRKCI